MSGLDKLKSRLNYHGGNQQGRFNLDKLKTLKKALLYSYQSAIIELADGRQFRALMNPDKNDPNYDNKILSIPYKDICLNKDRIGKTTEGEEEVGIKPGDIFKWVDNDTYWITYLQYLEETAYFRADCRACEKAEVELNGRKYRGYVRGPVETTIPWNQKNNIVWNTPNYTLVMYIPKNEYTLNYLKRFAKIKFDGKDWEVQTANPYYGEGVIMITVKEDFQNSMEENKESDAIDGDNKPEPGVIYIDGPAVIQPYDITSYTIAGVSSGSWSISNTKAKIIDSDANSVTIEVITGKSGSFDLAYKRDGEEDIVLPIRIISL